MFERYSFAFASAALAAALVPAGAVSQPAALTAPEALSSAATVNHAEYGRVTMQHTSSNACVEGEGEGGIRRQIFPIRFRYPFATSTYAVTLAVSGTDIDYARNFRLGTSVESKTRDGMTIVAHTWCNTIIHGATIDYMAAGRRQPH